MVLGTMQTIGRPHLPQNDFVVICASSEGCRVTRRISHCAVGRERSLVEHRGVVRLGPKCAKSKRRTPLRRRRSKQVGNTHGILEPLWAARSRVGVKRARWLRRSIVRRLLGGCVAQSRRDAMHRQHFLARLAQVRAEHSGARRGRWRTLRSDAGHETHRPECCARRG